MYKKVLMKLINNVSLVLKDNCCGCSACYESCPTKAIQMIPDEEGFLYPLVNDNLCIHCGICLKKCDNSELFLSETSILYACWSKSEEIRKRSSSGGAFTALSKIIFAKKGIVCGVGFNAEYDEVLHKIAKDDVSLDDLRRSKFVQSNKYHIYSLIKDILLQNKYVLFTGTPCEVGGLRSYLGKDFKKLITCDLICGCVSSPKVYKIYIQYLSNKYHSSVKSVNFKDKRNGWREKSIAVEFENGKEYYNSILDDDYVVSFHSRYNIRPSCFCCRYRDLKRVADLTLGDFWAVEKYNSLYDDNKGTSFVMANSSKGNSLLLECKEIMNIFRMDVSIADYCAKYNWCMCKNPTSPEYFKRVKFYNDLERLPFNLLSKEHLGIIKEERKKRKLGTEK